MLWIPSGIWIRTIFIFLCLFHQFFCKACYSMYLKIMDSLLTVILCLFPCNLSLLQTNIPDCPLFSCRKYYPESFFLPKRNVQKEAAFLSHIPFLVLLLYIRTIDAFQRKLCTLSLFIFHINFKRFGIHSPATYHTSVLFKIHICIINEILGFPLFSQDFFHLLRKPQISGFSFYPIHIYFFIKLCMLRYLYGKFHLSFPFSIRNICHLLFIHIDFRHISRLPGSLNSITILLF